ncbi:paired amphipathic helix protein Sin3a-like isoform X2 [Belonocnema kinseyi]|uniref:paired amphipathic helix protein Sin3a-like isoform X2 n=1 Tax=Belonocnema kinseyi TaxID=2817044 RepID=UPI00143D07BD|nr:paired amphipathic helix protein Sin3a-like isoform X2 [Belonocnema kinseyi]
MENMQTSNAKALPPTSPGCSLEDALSYLDQVKFKFSDQPQVYNDFVDIMKEFKFRSIDTPEAIRRVSHLFQDHPELIVDFNSFLPSGYKIEVQTNEHGYAYHVSVSMPNEGTRYTSISQNHCTRNVSSPPISSPSIPSTKAQPVLQIMQGSVSAHYAPRSNNISNNNSVHVSASSPVQSCNNLHVAETQAQENEPVKFDHAINYVNKIKNRFQGQPDTYKKFLEILHNYQKRLKEAEAEVYGQVAKLLENQEDLLQEFGEFLPDAANQQIPLTNKVDPINDNSTITKKPLGRKMPYNNYGALPRDHRDSG